MIDPEARDLIQRLADALHCYGTAYTQHENSLVAEARDLLAKPSTPLEDLGLSVRVYNALRRDGYHYVEQLDSKICKARWIGPSALEEIARALDRHQTGTKAL